MKLLKLIALLFVIVATVSAQNTVQGTVYNAEDNTSLPGVNVYIPELTTGVISLEDGTFILSNLPAGTFKVRFSYVGFETLFLDINTNTKRLYPINLKPSVLHSEEVVVSSGSYSSQHENAIKIENFHLHDGLDPAQINVFQSLESVPGVSVISKTPGISSPVIRGLSTNNILVLNHGIKLENYQFSQDHPYLINETGFRDVEIIKGPASLLYGSDAMGGVLNFIKSDPAHGDKTEGFVQSSWQTNTQGFQSALEIKGSNNSIKWGVNGNYKSHADYFDGNGNSVYNSRFNTYNAGTFMDVAHNKSRFKLYYDFNALKAGMPVSQAIEAIGEVGRKNEIWYQDLVHHLATLKHNLYLDEWKINSDVSYQNNQRKLHGSDARLVEMHLNTASANIKATRMLSNGRQIIASVQSRYQSNVNGDAPNKILPDYTLTDLAALGLYQFNVNQKIFLQVGARFDYRYLHAPEQEKAAHSHDEEIHEEGEAHLEEEDHFEALTKSYNNLSASAGLTYKVIPDGLIRFNLASAYRTPHVSELMQDGEHGTRYEIGDRNLKSQRNFEADLSFHYHSGIMVLEVAGFYNIISNYIFLNPTGEFTDENYPVYHYDQSNALLGGFESSIDLHPLKVLMLSGSYAYLHAVKEDGSYLPFIPQNKVIPSLTLHNLDGKLLHDFHLKVSLPVVFDQNKPSQFETPTNGYTLLNINAGIAINKVLLSVNVTNLLNKVYVDHLSTLKSQGIFNPGRNIGFNVSYTF